MPRESLGTLARPLGFFGQSPWSLPAATQLSSPSRQTRPLVEARRIGSEVKAASSFLMTAPSNKRLTSGSSKASVLEIANFA